MDLVEELGEDSVGDSIVRILLLHHLIFVRVDDILDMGELKDRSHTTRCSHLDYDGKR